MTTETLEFPVIEAPPTGAVATPPQKLLTVAEFVRAQFARYEPVLTMLATKHQAEKVVIGDAKKTPGAKSLTAAKEVRAELRKQGRFAVQNALEALKKDLNGAKGTAEAEAARLIAIVAPVEKIYDDAIKAEEERIEKERQAELDRQRVRKEGFDKAIRAILEYVNHAAGLPAERIARGIAKLDAMEFDPLHWQEFLADAVEAQCETLAKLREMHAQALERERLAAENERLRAELAARTPEPEHEPVAPVLDDPVAEQDALAEGGRTEQLQDLPTGERVDTATGEVLPPDDGLPDDMRDDPITPDEPDAEPHAVDVPETVDRDHALTAMETAAPVWNEPAAAPGPAAMKLSEICAALGFTMTKAFVKETLKVPAEDGPKGSLVIEGHRLAQFKAALVKHVEAWKP